MFCYSVDMSEKFHLPTGNVPRQRRKTAGVLGTTLLLATFASAKPIENSIARTQRGVAAATEWVGSPIVHTVAYEAKKADRNSAPAKLPALNAPFIVRGPEDTPDNIAVHSGIQGSENRKDFETEIINEAKAQGHDQLQQGMSIDVPEAYVTYANKQNNQQ